MEQRTNDESTPLNNSSTSIFDMEWQRTLDAEMQRLSGSLPDAGILGADFRSRTWNAALLMLAGLFFAILAIVIGLPTLLLKPVKFIMCMSLSSTCFLASVAVLKKPSVMLQEIMESPSPFTTALPIVALVSSNMLTLYICIFHRSYMTCIFAGAQQILAISIFLICLMPGGKAGVLFMFKSLYYVVQVGASAIYRAISMFL